MGRCLGDGRAKRAGGKEGGVGLRPRKEEGRQCRKRAVTPAEGEKKASKGREGYGKQNHNKKGSRATIPKKESDSIAELTAGECGGGGFTPIGRGTSGKKSRN